MSRNCCSGGEREIVQRLSTAEHADSLRGIDPLKSPHSLTGCAAAAPSNFAAAARDNRWSLWSSLFPPRVSPEPLHIIAARHRRSHRTATTIPALQPRLTRPCSSLASGSPVQPSAMVTAKAKALPAPLYYRPSPLLTLPPELICEIAEHLESLDDIERFRLTSTSIASVAAFVFARKFCNEKKLALTSVGLLHLAGRCLHPHFAMSLRSLSFRSAPMRGFPGLSEQSSASLQKSLKKLPNLKVIEFRRENCWTPSFPMNNKELSTLLSGMQSTGHLLEALTLYEYLGIRARPGINNLSPWTPEAKCPTALHKLNIGLSGTVPNGKFLWSHEIEFKFFFAHSVYRKLLGLVLLPIIHYFQCDEYSRT